MIIHVTDQGPGITGTNNRESSRSSIAVAEDNTSRAQAWGLRLPAKSSVRMVRKSGSRAVPDEVQNSPFRADRAKESAG